MLVSGAIDPKPLIDGTHPLDPALTAFEHAQRSGVLKILVDM
ncbi:MAG TPA: hypothetical protein VNM92_14385 [Thermoanaerobaculia bacterium]|nr:hypothetical protein [Thermoanaerobaculia bacterium]